MIGNLIINTDTVEEQERYAQYFSLPQDVMDRVGALKKTLKLGPDQEVYGKRFGVDSAKTEEFKGQMKNAPGAEADIYQNRFRLPREAREKIDEVKSTLKSEANRTNLDPFTHKPSLGVLKSAILPSFSLNSGLSLVTYGVARYIDRVELKDFLWPTGITANAWWSAIGLRMYERNMSLSTAWSSLSYPEKLLLSGVTAWGTRLLYRVASRSIERGSDDPRYEGLKKEEGFWNRALYQMFLPEAVFQTIISLPFALTFRDPSLLTSGSLIRPVHAYAEFAHMAAVFLFGSGFALEVIADAQLSTHRSSNWADINRSGVWSIVRHPK
jgi:steroid 5-alpha reductase family enzyme